MRSAPKVFSIPRPRGRGLIEAVGPAAITLPTTEFHDRAVVASLKHAGEHLPATARTQFHDRAVVASLKLDGRVRIVRIRP